jgi:hypothetical protein
MYMRVVRFTDVDAEHLESRVTERGEEDGPPEGVKAKGITVMHDPDQRTAVVVQLFETQQDMTDSEAALDGMDPSETPGTRSSVDRGEIKFEREA